MFTQFAQRLSLHVANVFSLDETVVLKHIMSFSFDIDVKPSDRIRPVNLKGKPKTKKDAKFYADAKSEILINKIVPKRKLLRINKFGNYTDENKIIYCKESNQAIGNELENGTLGPLTQEQIAYCESNNIRFAVTKDKKIETLPDVPPKTTFQPKPNIRDEIDESDIDMEDEKIECTKDEVEEESCASDSE